MDVVPEKQRTVEKDSEETLSCSTVSAQYATISIFFSNLLSLIFGSPFMLLENPPVILNTVIKKHSHGIQWEDHVFEEMQIFVGQGIHVCALHAH